MGQTKPLAMGFDRKEIDDKILDALHEGRNVPSNLADRFDVTRQYIQQRLQLLEAADHVENVGRGVYGLADDPREDAPTDDDLRGRLQDALESRDDAQAVVERLRDELDDCQDLLADARERSDVDVGDAVRSIRAARTALGGQNPDVDMARNEIDAALEVIGDGE